MSPTTTPPTQPKRRTKIQEILPSRTGRILIERHEPTDLGGYRILERRYGSASHADKLRAAGWVIFVPASSRGWKPEKLTP